MSDLLTSSEEPLRSLAHECGVGIRVQPCSLVATLDPDRMSQVLINLLSNAIKFSPKNGEVLLACEKAADGLTFRVSDEGPGIPKDLHSSIFDVFSKGKHKPAHQKVKGTGMGLAISKSIVEAHGGTIEIDSEEVHGCTFQIHIPEKAAVATQFSTALPGISTKAHPDSTNKSAKPKFRLRHKGLILISVPLVTQIIFVGTLAYFLHQTSVLVAEQRQARQAVAQAKQVIEDASDSSVLSFCCHVNGDIKDLADKQNEKTRLSTAKLLDLCKTDENRSRSAEKIAGIVTTLGKIHAHCAQHSLAYRLAELAAHPELDTEYSNLWNNLSATVNEFADVEDKREQISASSLSTLKSNLDLALLLGLGLSFASATALSIFLTRNITSRIAKVQQNAQKLLTKDALLPPITGSDEIAELDAAFHAAAKSLAEEQDLKQQLLAIASHELRSPLSSIYMTLTMVTEGAFGTMSQSAARDIAKAEVATERLIALINDILDIETMEAGKFVLNLQPTCARELTAEAIAAVQPLAQSKGILVENTVDEQLILADVERLNQALINLISNAIKFSPENQTVKLSSVRSDSLQMLTVSVIDNGSGIGSEMQARVFERYSRHEDTEQNPSGSGLGLSISKSIVEQHGGTIGVVSEGAKGSRFWFTVPYAGKASVEETVN